MVVGKTVSKRCSPGVVVAVEERGIAAVAVVEEVETDWLTVESKVYVIASPAKEVRERVTTKGKSQSIH